MKLSSEHITESFRFFEKDPFPERKNSTKWDVINPETGNKFPPKLILKKANELAGKSNGERGGGWPTNDILKKFGLVIVRKNLKEEIIEDLSSLIKNAKKDERKFPIKIKCKVSVYQRSENISYLVKKMASGNCDLCKEKSPFEVKGDPFLECHHVKHLADGGADFIDNAVALCPNCHRKMHALDLPKDRKILKNVIKDRKKTIKSIESNNQLQAKP